MLSINAISLEEFYNRINRINVLSLSSTIISSAFDSYYTYIEEVEQANKQLFNNINYGEYHIITLLEQALVGDEQSRIKKVYAFKYLTVPEPLMEQVINQLINIAQYDVLPMIKKSSIHTLPYIGSFMRYSVFNFLVIQGFHNSVAEDDGTAAQAKAALWTLVGRTVPQPEDERLIDSLIEFICHIERDICLIAIRGLCHWELINNENGKVFRALYRLVTDYPRDLEVYGAARHALEHCGGNLLLRMVIDPTFRNRIINAPQQAPGQIYPTGVLFAGASEHMPVRKEP